MAAEEKWAVLFDWNMTLLDDEPPWMLARDAPFHQFRKEDPFGPPLKSPPTNEEFFKKFDGDYLSVYRACGIDVPREEIDKLYTKVYKSQIDLFLSDERAGDLFNLFPGAISVVPNLARSGIMTGLVTAHPENLVAPLLEKFSFRIVRKRKKGPRTAEEIFHFLHFSATDKTTVIKNILEKNRLNPNNCFFVGDSPADMRQAKAAGIKRVAFLNGRGYDHLTLAELDEEDEQRDFAVNHLSHVAAMVESRKFMRLFSPARFRKRIR